MILVLTREQVTTPWVWFDNEQLIIKFMTVENASDQPRISWKHSENNWHHNTALCDVIVSRKFYRFSCVWFDSEKTIIKLMTGENASDQPRISWKHSENNWRHNTGLCDVIVSGKFYPFSCVWFDSEKIYVFDSYVGCADVSLWGTMAMSIVAYSITYSPTVLIRLCVKSALS